MQYAMRLETKVLSFSKVAEGCGLKGVQVKTQEELIEVDMFKRFARSHKKGSK